MAFGLRYTEDGNVDDVYDFYPLRNKEDRIWQAHHEEFVQYTVFANAPQTIELHEIWVNTLFSKQEIDHLEDVLTIFGIYPMGYHVEFPLPLPLFFESFLTNGTGEQLIIEVGKPNIELPHNFLRYLSILKGPDDPIWDENNIINDFKNIEDFLSTEERIFSPDEIDLKFPVVAIRRRGRSDIYETLEYVHDRIIADRISHLKNEKFCKDCIIAMDCEIKNTQLYNPGCPADPDNYGYISAFMKWVEGEHNLTRTEMGDGHYSAWPNL